MMLSNQQRNASELATPQDYRGYFGVPPKTSSPREFLRWSQSICAAVTRELDRTSLTSGQRDILRQGLATALKVLSGDCAGAVLR
jgi:hypothetical protein